MAHPVPGSLGQFIREQRQLAQLSLRELARLASVSNAYLSQVERGMHEPSIRVLNAVADVLEVPIGDLVEGDPVRSKRAVEREGSAELAIRKDARLNVEQK